MIATALGDDGPDGRKARGRIAGEGLAAPELLDLEVVSAFRRLSAAGRLSVERAGTAIIDLGELPVQRVPHGPLLARCWELRETVTVYDSVYIALAETLNVLLLTADRQLTNAPGPRCAVELVV